MVFKWLKTCKLFMLVFDICNVIRLLMTRKGQKKFLKFPPSCDFLDVIHLLMNIEDQKN